MKRLRFKASISPFFSGITRGISDDAAIKSKLIFSNGECSKKRCSAGFKCFNSPYERGIPQWGSSEKFHKQMAVRQQSRAFSGNGIQKIKKIKYSPPYNSSESEDNFSELIKPDVAAGLKLMTEKAGASLNAGASKKLLDNKPGGDASQVSLTGKKSPEKQGNHLAGHLSAFAESTHGVSRNESETQIQKVFTHSDSNYRNSTSIIIEKVPPNISLPLLRRAASVYGEISNASMKKGPNGFGSCRVEFKSTESTEKALAAQRITLLTCHLPIRPSVTRSLTIRIRNISMETAEPAVHSICMSCGSMEGLSRTKEGTVDVLFSNSDEMDVQSILNKLNDMSIDDCKWSAHVLPKAIPNSVADPQSWVGSQISELIGGFRNQSSLQTIYLADLEDLHQSVVHLRGHPSNTHL